MQMSRYTLAGHVLQAVGSRVDSYIAVTVMAVAHSCACKMFIQLGFAHSLL